MDKNKKDIQVEVVERLSESDNSSLLLSKVKAELAVEKAKAAQLSYDNIVLQLALKYKLTDGDIIGDDGVIQRKAGE